MSFHYVTPENEVNTGNRAELIGEEEKLGPGALVVSKLTQILGFSTKKANRFPLCLRQFLCVFIYLHFIHSVAPIKCSFIQQNFHSAYSLQVITPLL